MDKHVKLLSSTMYKAGREAGLLSTPTNLVTNVAVTKITNEKLFIPSHSCLTRLLRIE